MTARGAVVGQSTVDFVGIIKGGLFVAYDAKETAIKTRFPLGNIHQHQIDYLRVIKKLGGIAFFMIQFTSLHDDVFIVHLDTIMEAWNNKDKPGGKKSIPYDVIAKESKLIDPKTYITELLKPEVKQWLMA